MGLLSKGTIKLLCFSLLFSFGSQLAADEMSSEQSMNNERLDILIRRLDENTQGRPGFWQFKITTLDVTVITDENADRMRIIIPIVESDKLDSDILYRVMQANFDTALDARYAVAKNILWSAFIHPLSSLNDEEFLKGLGQTVNLVSTFGSSYSSGLLSFSGGDSQGIQQRQLIDELLRRGRETSI